MRLDKGVRVFLALVLGGGMYFALTLRLGQIRRRTNRS